MSETLRMNAYYYSFEPTGNLDVDRILSAVACAGKSYHHTEDWNTKDSDGSTVIETIQNAANDAAEVNKKSLDHLRRIVNNWNEFGHEAGIDELMHYASEFLGNLK